MMQPSQKGDSMPSYLFAIIGAVIGIVIGFVIARYLVNASTKKKEAEAQSIVEEAKRQADSIKREAEVEAKDEALKMRAEIEQERKERQSDSADRAKTGRKNYYARTPDERHRSAEGHVG